MDDIISERVGDRVAGRLRAIVDRAKAGEAITVGEDDPDFEGLRYAALPGVTRRAEPYRESMLFDENSILLTAVHRDWGSVYVSPLRVYYGDPATWCRGTQYGAGGQPIREYAANHTV